MTELNEVNGCELDFNKPLMNPEHAREVQERLNNQAEGPAQDKKEEEKLPM